MLKPGRRAYHTAGSTLSRPIRRYTPEIQGFEGVRNYTNLAEFRVSYKAK